VLGNGGRSCAWPLCRSLAIAATRRGGRGTLCASYLAHWQLMIGGGKTHEVCVRSFAEKNN